MTYNKSFYFGLPIYYFALSSRSKKIVQSNESDGYKFFQSHYPELRDNPVAIWKPSSLRLKS